MIFSETWGEPILRKQVAGFSLIIALSWIVEFLHVPHLMFNEAITFSWPRVLLRTGVVLLIWIWVHLSTRRLLDRVHGLEEYLRVCAWCRKVGHGDEWLTMEEYFGSQFGRSTSHGICPACAKATFEQSAATASSLG
jgi:hypothetical protein